MGLYAICGSNWNWRLARYPFIIKHWSQCTHPCSAPVVGLEEYSLGLVSCYSTVRSGTVTWHEWGLAVVLVTSIPAPLPLVYLINSLWLQICSASLFIMAKNRLGRLGVVRGSWVQYMATTSSWCVIRRCLRWVYISCCTVWRQDELNHSLLTEQLMYLKWRWGMKLSLEFFSLHFYASAFRLQGHYGMMTSSNRNIFRFRVSGEFPSQRPVTRSFDVFFDLCMNKQAVE